MPPQLPPAGPAISPANRAGTLAVWVIVIAGLYFAQAILIPLALAILLTFLLTPIAARLERSGLGRVTSTLLVMLFAVGIIGGIGYVVTAQFVDLAGKLPSYRGTIVKKLRNVRTSNEGAISRATTAFQELRRDVTEPTTATLDQTTSTVQKTTETLTAEGFTTVTKDASLEALDVNTTPLTRAGPSRTGKDEPLEVKVVEGDSGAMGTVASMIGPVLTWLGQAGIVVVFVLFMLLQRNDLRDRVIKLAGQSRIQVTTDALNEAGHKVSRYLLMQLIINVSYGIPVAIGLHFIGLPNAILWGVLATVLRFIPYIGPWLGAILPIILSVAVFDDWTRTFMVIGLYVVMELISNNLMEPFLYGHSTGVSPLAIIISAVFWTWLWGGLGLLLATPMTVCLSVLGRYVPAMSFLNVLLSDQPVLSPAARVYNRLLADNLDEGLDIVEEYLDDNPLETLYDDVLLCALAMAERDRHQNALAPQKQKLIWTSMTELLDAADEFVRKKELKSKSKDDVEEDKNLKDRAADTNETLPRHRVLILPARDTSDELAASMLERQLTTGRPHEVRVVSVEALAGEMIGQLHDFKPDTVYLSAMPPLATTHARYLVKRLKAECPDTRIIVGLWFAEGSMDTAVARLKGVGAESVVRTTMEALQRL